VSSRDAGWAVAGLLFQVVVALVVVLLVRERGHHRADTCRPPAAADFRDSADWSDPLGPPPADVPPPGTLPGDPAGFVRDTEARLAALARRIDRARSAPRRSPVAPPPAVPPETFVHVYYYYGRACDGLWQLQFGPDSARAGVVRQRLLEDLLAAERMLQAVEDELAGQPDGEPGPAVTGPDAAPPPRSGG